MKGISVIIPLGPRRELYALDSLKKQKEKVKIIVERGDNPSRNRNKGIRKAKTDLIAFINAHTILPDDWSERVSNFFEKHPNIDVVGGPQLTLKEQEYFGKVSGYALSSLFGSAEVSKRYTPKKLDLNANEKSVTSANLICRSSVLKKLKFDESLYPGEDPKFISECKEKGFRIAYSPSITVFHKRRSNARDLFFQIFNYGRARAKKESLFRTLKEGPLFIAPSLFIVYLSVLPFLVKIQPGILFPLFLYLSFMMFFSFYEGIKNRDSLSVLILPFLFFLIHSSYGAGFIFGKLEK